MWRPIVESGTRQRPSNDLVSSRSAGIMASGQSCKRRGSEAAGHIAIPEMAEGTAAAYDRNSSNTARSFPGPLKSLMIATPSTV